MKLYKSVIFWVLILYVSAMGQVSQTAVQFLLIAPGARAAGMGETFVAISDDATAVHWNPAGLGLYPLTGTWLDFKAAPQEVINEIVLVKNNLPEVNYRQYDVWGLVDGKLSRWNGETWEKGTRSVLKRESSLESKIVRYTGLSEENAQVYIDKLARANNEITPEDIDSLQTRIAPVIPSDYLYKEDIQYGFEKLHRAYLRLRIDVEGFNEIRADIDNALADSLISTETLDRIAFGFDRAISSKGDRSIWIPYDLNIPEIINCLGSDGEFLYVGTSEGLFKYDPAKFKWSTFTVESDSLPADNVTAIQKVGRRLMYIGTDKGITKFTGRSVKAFPPETGAPEGHISVITAINDRDAWVVSDGVLHHYDGFKWQSAREEEISIGENLAHTISSFYGRFGEAWNDKIMAAVARANSGGIDSVEAGQVIKLPYDLGYRGEITDLGVDRRGKLWIGTKNGIVLFNGDEFRQFGYKLYEVPEDGSTIEDIAAYFIPDRDSTKMQKLIQLIGEYNDLESDEFLKGTKLLVYSNSLGSEILSIYPVSDNKALVATSYGNVEYNKGKWRMVQNTHLADSRVSDIYESNGEMWFAAQDRVIVYASARKNVTLMHSNYLVQLADDLYYDYFSIVYPTHEWGTFGFGITFLSYGRQERTDELANALGSFVSYDLAFTLSYGTKLANKLSSGLSLRYINSHLAEVGAGAERGKGTGYSLAVDAGILYNLTRKLTLAATVTNLGPDIAYIDADQADPLPRKLAIGFNYKLVDSPFNRVTILGEADKLLVDLNDDIQTEIEEIIPHIGIEYWYSNYVALRSGYMYDKIGVQRYFTLGASLQYSNYRFDFSYVPSSNEDYNRLGNTMRFSMNVGF